MITWQKVEKDPFRSFFPLGAILALAGVTPWLGHFFGYTSYPRDLHRLLMVNGFLLSFVCGFLMTAVPRFTGTHFSTRKEALAVFVPLISAAAFAFSNVQSFNNLASAFALVFLGVFAGRRFLKRKTNPPHTFIFIGVGLFFWFISNVGQFLFAQGLIQSGIAYQIFQDLFSNGAIMCLILGVGGRLIPAILGWQDSVTHMRSQYETGAPYLSTVPFDIWVLVLVFVLSFFLEPIVESSVGFAVRGLVTFYFGIKYWRIYRLPKNRTYLSWGMWLCVWCLSFGYFLPAIWVNQSAHALHLLLVGGFSLLTLLISMRVTFAHGTSGTAVEKTNPVILMLAGVILLAMVTRVTAIIWPRFYLDHLGYAAATWIVGLLLWGWTCLTPNQARLRGEE